MTNIYLRPAVANDLAVIKALARAAHINLIGLKWPRFVVVENDLESFFSGSVTFLLAWIQRGSIGFSHGLFLGNRQASNRVPSPERLTC